MYIKLIIFAYCVYITHSTFYKEFQNPLNLKYEIKICSEYSPAIFKKPWNATYNLKDSGDVYIMFYALDLPPDVTDATPPWQYHSYPSMGDQMRSDLNIELTGPILKFSIANMNTLYSGLYQLRYFKDHALLAAYNITYFSRPKLIRNDIGSDLYYVIGDKFKISCNLQFTLPPPIMRIYKGIVLLDEKFRVIGNSTLLSNTTEYIFPRTSENLSERKFTCIAFLPFYHKQHNMKPILWTKTAHYTPPLVDRISSYFFFYETALKLKFLPTSMGENKKLTLYSPLGDTLPPSSFQWHLTYKGHPYDEFYADTYINTTHYSDINKYWTITLQLPIVENKHYDMSFTCKVKMPFSPFDKYEFMFMLVKGDRNHFARWEKDIGQSIDMIHVPGNHLVTNSQDTLLKCEPRYIGYDIQWKYIDLRAKEHYIKSFDNTLNISANFDDYSAPTDFVCVVDKTKTYLSHIAYIGPSCNIYEKINHDTHEINLVAVIDCHASKHVDIVWKTQWVDTYGRILFSLPFGKVDDDLRKVKSESNSIISALTYTFEYNASIGDQNLYSSCSHTVKYVPKILPSAIKTSPHCATTTLNIVLVISCILFAGILLAIVVFYRRKLAKMKKFMLNGTVNNGKNICEMDYKQESRTFLASDSGVD